MDLINKSNNYPTVKKLYTMHAISSNLKAMKDILYTTIRINEAISLVHVRALGSVHYLYPGLVPKRNGLGKPFFCSVKGWVISFLKKA